MRHTHRIHTPREERWSSHGYWTNAIYQRWAVEYQLPLHFGKSKGSLGDSHQLPAYFNLNMWFLSEAKCPWTTFVLQAHWLSLHSHPALENKPGFTTEKFLKIDTSAAILSSLGCLWQKLRSVNSQIAIAPIISEIWLMILAWGFFLWKTTILLLSVCHHMIGAVRDTNMNKIIGSYFHFLIFIFKASVYKWVRGN